MQPWTITELLHLTSGELCDLVSKIERNYGESATILISGGNRGTPERSKRSFALSP